MTSVRWVSLASNWASLVASFQGPGHDQFVPVHGVDPVLSRGLLVQDRLAQLVLLEHVGAGSSELGLVGHLALFVPLPLAELHHVGGLRVVEGQVGAGNVTEHIDFVVADDLDIFHLAHADPVAGTGIVFPALIGGIAPDIVAVSHVGGGEHSEVGAVLVVPRHVFGQLDVPGHGVLGHGGLGGQPAAHGIGDRADLEQPLLHGILFDQLVGATPDPDAEVVTGGGDQTHDEPVRLGLAFLPSCRLLPDQPHHHRLGGGRVGRRWR